MIPIYRAKNIDTNEYVEGWYTDPIIIEGELYISITNKSGTFRVDKTTIAIHFKDMIDAKGSKIFASLQEGGKGGDIFITENDNTRDGDDIWTREEYGETTAIISMHGLNFTDWKIEDDRYDSIYSKRFTKKIGIQQ